MSKLSKDINLSYISTNLSELSIRDSSSCLELFDIDDDDECETIEDMYVENVWQQTDNTNYIDVIKRYRKKPTH